MKRNGSLFLSVVAVITLILSLPLSAEVALDEVVQAGRFVFYRDHADPHKYYYVPDEPRLASKRDGTPEFTFIKYSKTDGATKGGVVHFLVTWGYSGGELSSAESALKLTDPQAKVAGPVPFKEGTFRIVSATTGEGGLFTRRIVGEGKAPVMPNQKAAVSIALTEEGASLLWESFKNPASDISVQFVLKFAGLTPAFQAKLKVDWDKVYSQHDIKLAAEGTIKVVKLRADLRATLEELRQKGAIQLDVVGENENMQKMLDTAYEHILSLMCDRVPTGAGESAAPPVRRPVAGLRTEPGGRVPLWLGEIILCDSKTDFGERVEPLAVASIPRGPNWGQQEQQVSGQTSDCSTADRRRADQLYQKGLALGREKKYNDAIDYFKKAYAACSDPRFYYQIGLFYDNFMYKYNNAREYYQRFLELAGEKNLYENERNTARNRISVLDEAETLYNRGLSLHEEGKYAEAAEEFLLSYGIVRNPNSLYSAGTCFADLGDKQEANRRENYERAVEYLKAYLEAVGGFPDGLVSSERIQWASELITELEGKISGVPAAAQGGAQQIGQQQARADQTGQQSVQSQAAAERATTADAGLQQTAKPPGTTEGGAKPPVGAGQQTTSSGQSGKPPDTGAGTKPPAGQAGQAAASTPAAPAPEVKPIVSVQLGYSFKRIKLSGRYEVDMRKRLREDREVVMSGNIGGIYKKYGEDSRFFTVVSLDDPAFQERTVEVILDGQDAEDFKNYINSVSVLFRRQRFNGPTMTGEVKFFEQQFADRGNRLSFKYGRLNEAATEWLDYEYKPKWSFYGGVEWEGEWTKTSDSVLTLSPPVRRRTIEISVDEDDILKNRVKAVAIQVRHRIFGKDIIKEVVINYDKGDPLQVNYTYMHEEGRPGYSYRAVWLTLDGREVEGGWVNRESPFVYALFGK